MKNFKRGISLILALSMLLALFTFNVGASTYPSDDYWANEALNAAVKNKILYGRENGYLDPEANLTRAEMAAIVVRSFGATIRGNVGKFVDVEPSSWYYEYMQKAVHMGAFIGNGNGYMYPDNYITREEIMTVLARLIVFNTSDYSPLNKYPDKDEMSDWAKPYASALVARKYINGNEKGMITPKNNVTRAEFAQMMHNIFKTYYSEPGKYNTVNEGGVMINKSGVELSDMTINGDLVVGDGVGYGTLKLNNVKVNGRILFRGGEKLVTLTKTTVGENIVIYDINGVVNFNNYRTEAPFKNIKELTKAKFKMRAGGGSSSTPSTPSTPTTYHTVTFFNSVDPSKESISEVKINTALDEANKTLKYANKNIDTIYGNPDKKVTTYNRSSISAKNGAIGDVSYNHQANMEYIFEESNGVWKPFTEETIVNRDIDVYLAGKHFLMNAELMGLPYTPDIAYDSESRAFDSFKDLMILTGLSLDNARTQVEEKILPLYEELNSKTGMVDNTGNILDRDYGMKIVDVIFYDQIEAEIQAYIDDIIVGKKDESPDAYKERLASFLSLIDIPYLVSSIGGKKLVDMLPETTLRDLLKNNSVKAQILPKIQSSLKDKDQADALIDGILANEDATKNLISNLMNDSAFIASMIEANPQVGTDDYDEPAYLHDKLLEMIKGDEIKDELLDCFRNEAIANEIITLVKADSSFKNAIVSNTQDSDEAKDKKKALRKSIIALVAESGKSPYENDFYDDMSENAKKVKELIVKKIENNSSLPADIVNNVRRDYVYEAVLEVYVTGEYSPFLDDIQGASISVNDITDYEAVIDAIVEEFIDEYFEGKMDAELLSIVNGAIVDFAEDYIEGNEIDESLLPVIETNIVKFIASYFKGEVNLEGEAATKIATLAESVKEKLAGSIEEIDDKTIFKTPIVNFVTNEDNSDTVDKFVKDNYEVMAGIITKDFILNFIKGMGDDEVNSLISGSVDVIMIVDTIYELPTEPVNERKKLANEIRAFLDSYDAFTDFMDAFKYKKETFKINKKNLYFAEAVGSAINGFSFERIYSILEAQGFGPVLNLIGKDVVEQMFIDAKNDYWNGLKPVIEDVRAKTDSSNPDYVSDSYESEYTTKLNVTVRAASMLRGIYNKKAAEFKNKIVSSGIYDYTHNTALKTLVNIDWFNLVIGYDKSKENPDTKVTGYYIRDYMEYYTALLDIAILYDDALCFYNTTNYDDEKMKEVKKSLTKDFLEFLETMNELSEKIESGEAIYKNATLTDLINKVDSLKSTIDSAPFIGEYAGAIKDVIDRMKGILTDLGQGNLPAGYTLADMEVLSGKLKTVISAMNENDYNQANTQFKSAISSTLSIVDSVLARLDNGGLEALISNVQALNTIYKRFEKQIKGFISALANADFGSLDVPFDSEKLEDIVFGRETDNIFNIDSIFDVIKGKLGTSGASGFNPNREVYVVDSYTKTVQGNTVTLERTFYNSNI